MVSTTCFSKNKKIAGDSDNCKPLTTDNLGTFLQDHGTFH